MLAERVGQRGLQQDLTKASRGRRFFAARLKLTMEDETGYFEPESEQLGIGGGVEMEDDETHHHYMNDMLDVHRGGADKLIDADFFDAFQDNYDDEDLR